MPSDYPQRELRDPVIGPGDQPYFDAAGDGTLRLKQCGGCGARHHYPRALCPFCMSDDVHWTDAAGTGEIYSFSVTRPAGAMVYCIAFVTLDEGPTMMTNIVDCDLDAVRIGQRVRVVFKRTRGGIAVRAPWVARTALTNGGKAITNADGEVIVQHLPAEVILVR